MTTPLIALLIPRAGVVRSGCCTSLLYEITKQCG